MLQAKPHSFDVVITDLILPGVLGKDIVECVRKKSPVPIIVTSALDKPQSKLDLFELGVDDYLTKPFDFDELYARITVQLKHYDRENSAPKSVERAPSRQDKKTILYQQWTLKPEERILEAAGCPVELTRIEYNIVEVLMQRPTKVFTKKELFELAWHEDCFVEEKAVNVHMCNIRAKLKETGTSNYIQTVWGVGFKLAEE